MATNNDGMGGVVIEHIAIEKSTLIGMQAPNKRTSVRESEDRVMLPELTVSPTRGCIIEDKPHYDCEPIDTSWINYGGRYTLGVGNKWHIRVGGGGIYTETIGPIQTDGEIAINNIKKGFFVQTNLFQVVVGKRAMMAGPRMDFNFDEIYFKGKAKFLNNVIINGGLYVNGEMVCNHQSSGGQLGTTGFNQDNLSYITPAQSFHIFQGVSKAAEKYTTNSLLGTTFEGLDITDGDDLQSWVEAEMVLNTDFITQIIPGLDKAGLSILKFLLCLPIKLKFPKGISLLSDAVNKECPDVYPFIESVPRTMGVGEYYPDTFGPGHVHPYYGPSCNFVGGSLDVYSEGQQMDSVEPVKNKPTIMDGAPSMEAAMSKAKTKAEAFKIAFDSSKMKYAFPIMPNLATEVAQDVNTTGAAI